MRSSTLGYVLAIGQIPDTATRRTGNDHPLLYAAAPLAVHLQAGCIMIRKLKSGEYRLYSRKRDPRTGRRRNLGTFSTREAAEKHERDVQYFKRH